MGTILGVLRLTPERLEEVERDEAVYWRADEEAEYGDDLIDIDKAWDALHFLFDPARRRKGGRYSPEMEAAPTTLLGRAVLGSHRMYVGSPTWHDLIPRYNTAAEVAEMASALDGVDLTVLYKEHRDALAESDDLGPHAFDYVRPWFEAFRSFYRMAAAQREAMILSLG